MGRKEEVIQVMETLNQPITASELAERMTLDRANVSRYLNDLVKEKMVKKLEGRPVRYVLKQEYQQQPKFDQLVGFTDSLKVPIQKAKAAILYPPHGLHTIIFGETGTGKSLFAECMYEFAKDSGMLSPNAPFISFNCADYAQNPQLLFSHIFGVKKGAFTGAEEDSAGLVAQADGGILFLDEIHRLPPEGQEMLFTFIDKGIYRPLGESTQVNEANVQIIGATTENSSQFLTTFNRRIPMTIELPALDDRSLEERLSIVSLFFQMEANRLGAPILVERDALLAFMLYRAEANVGQVKRDVKLVCAKAFLHYRTEKQSHINIEQQDLPINVQKGLLRLKEMGNRLDSAIPLNQTMVSFRPGRKNPLNHFSEENESDNRDALQHLMQKDQMQYFEKYVEELRRPAHQRYQVSEEMQSFVRQLYSDAEIRLNRHYDDRTIFAFAMHLQTVLDRLRHQETIIHPNLNAIRKQYLTEFQVAMELSDRIETKYDISLPLDEIGFITMFLALPEDTVVIKKDHHVGLIMLMHGEHTASNMLQTAQELLNTTLGVAFDMPLTSSVPDTYQELLAYVKEHQAEYQEGLLLLTDMGSLNRFADMLQEEMGIPTRAISMTSTPVVLEALRLVMDHHLLDDIYQRVIMAMQSMMEQNQPMMSLVDKPKAIVVTCFTGEGVATKLNERVHELLDKKAHYQVIQMQFLELQTFRHRIDELLLRYDIKAIVGTVAIHYQNIPYFPAMDIFNEQKTEMFQRILEEEIPLEEIALSLEHELTHVDSVQRLLGNIREQVYQIQNDLNVFVEASVEAGILMHIAFLIDELCSEKIKTVPFIDIETFKRMNKLAFDTVVTQMMPLEKEYCIRFNEEQLAHLTQMFLQNQVNSTYLDEAF